MPKRTNGNEYERQARLTDNYSQIPHGLWTADLSWGAKCLLGWLHSHDPRYVATLTNQRIRRELGCSGIVGKWFSELEDAGFITVERTEHRNRVVILAAPWEALAQRPRRRSGNGQDDAVPEPEVVKEWSSGGQEMTDNRSGNDHIEDKREDHGGDQVTLVGDIVHHAEVVPDWVQTFDAWWKLQPRKIAKDKARKIWQRMTADERTLALEVMPHHIEHWRSSKTEAKFIPHPTTWLNQRRWEDELATEYQPQGSLVQQVAAYALQRRRMENNGEHRGHTGGTGQLVRGDNRME